MSLGKITSWEPCRCSVAQGKPLSHFTGLCWACSLYRATKWQKKDLWICLSPRADEMNKAAKLSWRLLSFRVSPSCPSPAYLTPSILPSAPSVFPLQYGTFPWSLLGPQLDKAEGRDGNRNCFHWYHQCEKCPRNDSLLLPSERQTSAFSSWLMKELFCRQ